MHNNGLSEEEMTRAKRVLETMKTAALPQIRAIIIPVSEQGKTDEIIAGFKETTKGKVSVIDPVSVFHNAHLPVGISLPIGTAKDAEDMCGFINTCAKLRINFLDVLAPHAAQGGDE